MMKKVGCTDSLSLLSSLKPCRHERTMMPRYDVQCFFQFVNHLNFVALFKFKPIFSGSLCKHIGG